MNKEDEKRVREIVREELRNQQSKRHLISPHFRKHPLPPAPQPTKIDMIIPDDVF